MKTSLVVTVLNEERSIAKLISSIFSSSKLPDEVIIVDAGSTDRTREIVRSFNSKIRLFTAIGNRAFGRNYGIAKAKHEIILLTDAGCVLDRRWVEEIQRPFVKGNVDVVAGYYAGYKGSVLQNCLVPYVLVMPDRLNPASFLPSARSMAIRKNVWRKLKGFPEQFSRNEDYVFARRIKQEGYRIAFAPKAIVYWIPSETIIEAMRMFARDARGDAEAGLIRAKVMLLFARYISFIVLLIFVLKLSKGYLLLFGVLMAYIIWSVDKNYHYMPGFRSILIFPLLQIIADASVIYGTLRGFVSRCLLFFSDKRFYRVIK